MTLRDRLASLIRTGVPYLVGLLLTWLGRNTGIVLDDGSSAELTAWLVLAAGTAYYALIRWAETRWPRVGWLLGWALQPKYADVVKGEVVSVHDESL
jgi:hypothetical protein